MDHVSNHGSKIDTPDHSHTKYNTFRFLGIFIPLAILIGIDLTLSSFGALPPIEPLASLSNFPQHLFVEEQGVVTIREDMVNDGLTFQYIKGKQKGVYYIIPGFRRNTFTHTKSPQSIRIFVLGDSTPFGAYVGKEKSFPSILEKKIQSLLGNNQRVEVINLSMAGLNSLQITWLTEEIIQYGPDLIIVYVGNNEMIFKNPEYSKSILENIRQWILDTSAIARWMDFGINALKDRIKTPAVSVDAREISNGNIPVTTFDTRVQSLPTVAFRDQAARDYERNLKSINTVGILFF